MSEDSGPVAESPSPTLAPERDTSSENGSVQKEVCNGGGGSNDPGREEDDVEDIPENRDSDTNNLTHSAAKNGCSESNPSPEETSFNDSHKDTSKKYNIENSEAVVNGHPSSPGVCNLSADKSSSEEARSETDMLNGSKHADNDESHDDVHSSSSEPGEQDESVDQHHVSDDKKCETRNSETVKNEVVNSSSTTEKSLDEKSEIKCDSKLNEEMVVKMEASDEEKELDLRKNKVEPDEESSTSCAKEEKVSIDSKDCKDNNSLENESNPAVDNIKIKQEKSDEVKAVKSSSKVDVKRESKVSECNGSSSRESCKSEVSRASDNHMKPSISSSPSHKGSKSKPPPDNMRSVGRLLYDLGLDLVRQEVYKDLIDIQAAKDDEHKLDEKEKGQLVKLTEAHARLRTKNNTYCIPRIRCSTHCRYSSTSENILQLHREHGHISSSQPGIHVCCLCEAFRTRFPSQFVTHMETIHNMNGKLTKKPLTTVCSFCPYEHKNATKVEAHAAKCAKKFQLASNLQPLPSDCDIPIKHRPVSSWSRPMSGSTTQYDTGATNMSKMQAMNAVPGGGNRDVGNTRYSSPAAAGSQSNAMEIGGQMYSWSSQRGKPMNSFRSPVGSPAAAGSGLSTPTSINMACSSSGIMRPMGMQQPQQRINSPQNLTSRSGSAAQSASQQKQQQSGNRRSEICEICGMNVENRQALWTHLHSTHKLELSRVSMNEQEPCIVCDICKARFWTYQGLARHSLLLHKRNISTGGSSGSSASGVTVAGARSTFRCHLCGASQTVNPLNHLSTHHNITLLDMYHGRQCCMCNRKLRNGRAFEEHMIKEHRDIFANQDVLRTVLQALSTALYLKSEDIHQQRMPQPQAMQQQQQARQQQQQIQQAAAAAAAMAVRQRGPSGSFGPQNNVYRGGSPGSMQNMRPRTPMYVNNDKRSRPRTPSARPEPIVIPTKPTPEKKTTEEETKVLNKLYEDYADIGRPISRAMKHKLLLSPNSTATGASTSSDRKSNGDAASFSESSTEKPIDASIAGVKSLSSAKASVGGGVDEHSNERSEKRAASESAAHSSEVAAKKPRLDDNAMEKAAGGEVDSDSSAKIACSTVS